MALTTCFDLLWFVIEYQQRAKISESDLFINHLKIYEFVTEFQRLNIKYIFNFQLLFFKQRISMGIIFIIQ